METTLEEPAEQSDRRFNLLLKDQVFIIFNNRELLSEKKKCASLKP